MDHPLPAGLIRPDERSLDTVHSLHVVRPADLAAVRACLAPEHRSVMTAIGFAAAATDRPVIFGTPGGEIMAIAGIGDDRSHLAFGDLANTLPQGDWRLLPGDYDPATAVLGFALGAYRFDHLKTVKRPPARLVLPAGCNEAAAMAATIGWVRDLINTPANLLGPMELAEQARAAGERYGASIDLISGETLATAYPAIAAVGAAAARPPCVVILLWRGSTATDDAPLISLCGKGVVFDTGGLDLKPSSAMLRMKKDMGGAAILLGVAETLMRRNAPIRLALRLGCVENSVSGAAMRPGDVVRTRAALTVEVGNTDAEGRLVLADLLADAVASHPTILIDCATLTGAARVAVGPDLPALLCNNDTFAEQLLQAGRAEYDPIWRLPLWDGYADWLASPIADTNNVSTKPYAGAIVAGLFLRRFIPVDQIWAHVDAYAWNDSSRPARPEGGEAQALRAIVAAITARFHTDFVTNSVK